MNNDDQLVASVLAGDTEAFGQLVERYQDRLYNTLYRVLGSREDALDVAQDAFVQALVKLDTFRGAAKFYTWLYRIAMNLALSHRRRRRPVASIDQHKEQAGEEPADTTPEPESMLMEDERAATLHTALGNLGTEHRQILVLREMEGCSYEAIAAILSLPVGTVRSRLFRARLQLREQLESLLQGEMDPSN